MEKAEVIRHLSEIDNKYDDELMHLKFNDPRRNDILKKQQVLRLVSSVVNKSRSSEFDDNRNYRYSNDGDWSSDKIEMGML